jgi:xylan 1,4-beta-xylosidase
VKTPFYGGYGLIAELHLPKAAFRVFELLHGLGEQRVPIASENALVTKRANGIFVIALWNYNEPGESVQPKTFQLTAQHLKAKSYRMQFVSPEHGSVLEAWRKMGSPAYPSANQVQRLRQGLGARGGAEIPHRSSGCSGSPDIGGAGNRKVAPAYASSTQACRRSLTTKNV